jgi:hypothetical protein
MDSIKIGDCLRVKTKDEKYGVCFYEVIEVNISFGKIKNGVRSVMLGGSGVNAMRGYIIMESENNIHRDIKSGITEIISKNQAEKELSSRRISRKSPDDILNRPSKGCVELD